MPVALWARNKGFSCFGVLCGLVRAFRLERRDLMRHVLNRGIFYLCSAHLSVSSYIINKIS